MSLEVLRPRSLFGVLCNHTLGHMVLRTKNIPMQIIDRESNLWKYLTDELKGLITDGEEIIDHAIKHGEEASTDFSYLVFSFAKAYEGFLKRLFLDLEMIQEDEYYGDDIRIGRILNPNFMKDNENIYSKLSDPKRAGKSVATKMWEVWRKGRNQVFHYFPHNFRRLSYDEAMELIGDFANAMAEAVDSCKIS